MADMEIVPLFGSSFSVYAPIITAIVGFITFFNIYGRILKFFGIQDEDSVTVGEFCTKPNDTELEEIETGKKLVTGQIRRLNDILLAENRAAAAAAMNKDTVALLPGSPNNLNALGVTDEEGDLELTGGEGEEDEENSSQSRGGRGGGGEGGGDMTSWGKASPATSSFYSSFRNEKKRDTSSGGDDDSVSEKKKSSMKDKEENYLFGSWGRSKEMKSASGASGGSDSMSPLSRVDQKKLDDTSSSSKDYKSLTTSSASSFSRNSNTSSQETKGGFSNISNSSSVTASESPRVNDAWGATGGGWDVPAPTRKGGRYG
jgi:hypothetical protein